jgi:hypothetical protein
VRSRPSPDEGGGSRDGDESLGNGCELFIVAHEPAVLYDPGEGPFDHPPAPDYGKARLFGAALHDLHKDVRLSLGPANQPTGIASVPVSAFNEGKASP